VTLTLDKEVIAGRWKIFQWAGTGAVRGKMGGCDVRPEWWGAVPNFVSDGTGADCKAAIQAANDHLEARVIGIGRLLFSAGMYGISGTLKVGQDGMTWQGAGKGKRHIGKPSLGQPATVIHPISNISSSGGPAILIKNQNGTRRSDSVTIRDMSISGDNRYFNAANSGARWFQHGIEMNHVAKITLENLVVEYCNQDGIYCASDGVGGPDQSHLHNVIVSQCARIGVSYLSGNEHLYHLGTVDFCGITAGSPGIKVGGINGVHIAEVSIESNYGPGVEMTTMGDFTIFGCGFEANSRTQAAIDPTDDSVVHILIGSGLAGVNGVRIQNSYFTATEAQNGIHKHIYCIRNARSVQLTGNMIWQPVYLGGTLDGGGNPVAPVSPSTIIYFDPAGTFQEDVLTDQHGVDFADTTMPYISNNLAPLRGLSWRKQAPAVLTYNSASIPAVGAGTELPIIPVTTIVPPGFCKPFEPFEFFAVGSVLVPTIDTATFTVRIYVGASSVWTGATVALAHGSAKRPFILSGEFCPTDTTHGQMWAQFLLGGLADTASPGYGSISNTNLQSWAPLLSEAGGFSATWASGLTFKVTGALSAVNATVNEVVAVEKWHVRSNSR
jgi:hypothetical protein